MYDHSMPILNDPRLWGVIVVSDRGDLYLPECLANIGEALPEAHILLVDDQEHRMGMAGAVRRGMEMALAEDFDCVFWVEEDFRLNKRPPLEEMCLLLAVEPQCAQVVLKRQPWSVEEHQAGGIIEMAPNDYIDRTTGDINWLEHRRIFSLNPCLIPRWVLERGWPDGNEAEQTERLVADGASFAFYGKREDPPLVQHVGHERGSGWRL